MNWTNLHRFFVRADCVCEGKVILDGEQARQICSVLRLGQGDHIAALDGSGCALIVRITKGTPARMEGDVIQSCPVDTEPQTKLTIVQSLPKADKLEFVIQKGTELGVARFIVTTTERTVARPDETRIPAKLARWQAIAREAAEQSCRGLTPDVVWVNKIDELLAGFQEYDAVICLWESEVKNALREVLNACKSSQNMLMIIGPEGGLTEEEVGKMQSAGAMVASLGKRVLRCETAAIAAASVIFYELG